MWQAVMEIEPFGEDVWDIRLASLKSLILACHGSTSIPLEDLIINWDGEDKTQQNVAENVLNIFSQMATIGKAKAGGK